MKDICYEEMTINEFNKEYGVNAFGYPKYKIASNDDIGTFVRQEFSGASIPYFSTFFQENTPEALPETARTGIIIKIIKDK